MFVIGVHGSYCSYKTARTFNEPFLVERRLSFTVEVTTATGNWKHLLLLKIIFLCPFPMVTVVEMAGT